MIFAMNLYDIVDGKEHIYKEYMKQSVELMDGIDAEPVAAGHNPRKELSGNTRGHFVIMKFGSMKDFDALMARQEASNVNKLREEATENYIWTMYDEWDIGAWLYSE
jgi:uncharacterized protein (DUF1330 family)